MGQSDLNIQIFNMKFAIVVCLAALAAAEPEAKPKADAGPALLYGAYGYGGLGYGYGLGYRTYGYAGYPYVYGKRSADAEPKADADAALLYGAYGYAGYPYAGYSYGYPYAYGAYGYYERDPLMLSQRLMLVCIMVDTTDMPDLMPMDTEPMDTHTGDKSQTHFKDSTKQKLKANNIQL